MLGYKTTASGVKYQIGSAGMLRVIVLHPAIRTDDAEYNRIRLSFDYFQKAIKFYHLGVGSTLTIDIEPSGKRQIKFINKDSESEFEVPLSCPKCGSKLNLQDKYLYCTNHNCPGMNTARMANIDGLLNYKWTNDKIKAGRLQIIKESAKTHNAFTAIDDEFGTDYVFHKLMQIPIDNIDLSCGIPKGHFAKNKCVGEVLREFVDMLGKQLDNDVCRHLYEYLHEKIEILDEIHDNIDDEM